MPSLDPISLQLSRRQIVAILLSLILAQFVHAHLMSQLLSEGVETDHAYSLSYYVVPLIVVTSLAMVLPGQYGFVRRLLYPTGLDVRIALAAIALGLLLRVAYWGQLIARVSFGIGTDTSPGEAIGPSFTLGCPPLHVVALGFLVLSLIVPLTEELVHRGLLQSALAERGPVIAIAFSATTFAVFHQSPGFALYGGIVLGVLFWRTRILWPAVIAHATYNAVVQLDWRCLDTVWRPADDSLPLIVPGLIATAVFVGGLALSVLILARVRPRHAECPGHPD